MQTKYRNKVKLRFRETDSFVNEIETEDFYKDIAKNVETRFDTSAYSRNESTPLPV